MSNYFNAVSRADEKPTLFHECDLKMQLKKKSSRFQQGELKIV